MPKLEPTPSGRQLQRALAAMRGRRVAVIGDCMLDCFLWGDATRISPEAPVPVVLLESQTWSLGGAANVAANIASLGGQPCLFSSAGQDAAARRLRRLAVEAGIEIAPLAPVAQRATTVKYRVLARNKHLLRFDRESTEPVPLAATRSLLATLAARDDLQAVVVSDYAKGMVTPELVRGLSRWCAARRIPWCVDPKLNSLRYRHATVLKPNQSELGKLSGLPTRSLPEVRHAARLVLRQQGCQNLLVTRGQHGMALYSSNGSERLFNSHGHAVADVTGAGDTVSAVIGLALAARLPISLATALANLAGGFVVSRPGIAVVRPEDLLHSGQEGRSGQ